MLRLRCSWLSRATVFLSLLGLVALLFLDANARHLRVERGRGELKFNRTSKDLNKELQPLLKGSTKTVPTKPKYNFHKSNWLGEYEEGKEVSIDLEGIETKLRRRKNAVREACSTISSTIKNSPSIRSKEFFINTKYKLVWCNIFKSASSTWIYNFLILANAKEAQMKRSQISPVQYAREYFYPRPTQKYLTEILSSNEFTSFIIVRDPFERLLSSYLDKIESHYQKYYKKLRCTIAKNPNINSRKPCDATFAQFVEYIVEQEKSGQWLDEHWQSYERFCTPCLVNYTYILRFELLHEEGAFLIEKVAGLSSRLQRHQVHASHRDYEAVTQKYYHQLSSQQLDQLLLIYKHDFVTFNYTWDKYYDYVK